MVASHRVFVVDDEAVIASTLADVLNVSGFSARSFSQSLEALVAARQELPDILIADVMMPELSGIELAILINALCPRCYILLSSGHPNAEPLVEDARRRGYHFPLLVKPVLPTEMLSEIAKARAGRLITMATRHSRSQPN